MVHINGKPQTWSNTRVFRSSVLPHDQDPENANGGQAILRLSLKDWNVCFWLNLLAVVFDGQLSFVEHVTGIVGITLLVTFVRWMSSLAEYL